MSTLNTLIEKRNNIVTQMEDLKKRRDTEKRTVFNTEERTQWDRMWNEYNELKSSIDDEKRMKEINSLTDSMAERIDKQESEGKNTYERSFATWIKKREGTPESDMRILQTGQVLEARGTSTQSTGTNSLGGYTIPQEWENDILKIMTTYGGGLLAAATTFNTENGNKITQVTGEDTQKAYIVAEHGNAIGIVDTSVGKIDLDSFMYSTGAIKSSIQLVRDSKYDMVAYIKEVLGQRMGRGTHYDFTVADGSNKPLGIVPASTLGATAAGVSRVKLIQLKMAVDQAYRSRGSYMFNSATASEIMQLSIGSADDRPLWQTSMRDGEPDRLEGRPVLINEDMANIASAAKPVLFGDFSQYRIRRVGSFEIFAFNEMYMGTLEKAWFGFAAFDGDLFVTKAVKHLVIS